MSYVRDRYEGEGTRELRGAQRPLAPTLAPDEQVILRTQGGYKDNMRPVWKLGRFWLTDQRLLFFLSTHTFFETPLPNIKEVKVERQRYVGGGIKDTIALGYQNPINQRLSKAWLIMPQLETWRKELHRRTLLKVDQETLDKIMEELDPLSREIVDHLWQTRHATISELAELVAAPAHMDVLLRIKGIINPTAERIIGYPLLVFESLRVAQETGEKILFSWWITAPARIAERKRKGRLVDVFEEADHIDVVAELPGVREEDIGLTVARDRVIISADGGERGYHEEIVLPGEVNPDKFVRTYNNNILALSLQKPRNSGSAEVERKEDDEMEKITTLPAGTG